MGRGQPGNDASFEGIEGPRSDLLNFEGSLAGHLDHPLCRYGHCRRARRRLPERGIGGSVVPMQPTKSEALTKHVVGVGHL